MTDDTRSEGAIRTAASKARRRELRAEIADYLGGWSSYATACSLVRDRLTTPEAIADRYREAMGLHGEHWAHLSYTLRARTFNVPGIAERGISLIGAAVGDRPPAPKPQPEIPQGPTRDDLARIRQHRAEQFARTRHT